ncbi:NAD(P)H-dependent flavin oxidoreductase [Roseibium aggregatum]|uniref:NAD(P)H-dependent flavin oxidoreductase n=1 Tax=Roseibium aggregatum TaxID=187304 RepID=UPI001E57E9E1|nr:nitronate monooxygenase [Roseibium aggregatum]
MKQLLETPFTRRFAVSHPVVLAPMDRISDGRLAAEVSRAGGFGIIGAGYGDPDWIDAAFDAAGDQRVGLGVITWSLLKKSALVDRILDRNPAALFVSFGDAEPIVKAARERGIPTIWQVQRLDQAEQALKAGTDVLVAQGQEGGGHGMDRGLSALLPAVRDAAGKETIVLAAGGLADGRGLAAALMLGADGVMMGTRFWASVEANGSEKAKVALTKAHGDDTARSSVFDVARGLDWPSQFTGRVVQNAFSRPWLEDPAGLSGAAHKIQKTYEAADPDDYSVRALIAGESLDLVQTVQPAARIVENTVREAAALLARAPDFVIG